MLERQIINKPLPLFRRTPHSIETRMDEWDYRYAAVDIKEEQSQRLLESEYRAIIDDEILKLPKDTKRKLKCLELACGTAPWAKYLSQNKNLDVECADYSKVVVDRLRKERGLNAFTVSINDLTAVPDNTYDLIIMAGGIYEDHDPYYVADVYREVSRILKPAGIYIQFCNRFLNFSNTVLFVKQRIRTAIGDFIYARQFNIVRKIIKMRIPEKQILFWLLPLNLIGAFARAANMSLSSRHYIQHEVGLAETLFFLPCFKRFDLYRIETALINKDEIFRRWFLFLAGKIRRGKSKHICRAVALVFKKQI